VSRRPVIGLTCGSAGVPVAEGVLPSHYVGLAYTRSLGNAGALSLVLPAVQGSEEEDAVEIAELLDGLLLAGGTDIHPETYGVAIDPERTQKPDRSRDRFEIALVHQAKELGLPILGICRGFQILNVAYGGTLDQHRPHEGLDLVAHDSLRIEATNLSVKDGSLLGAALGTDRLQVYCLHHQAVDRIGHGLQVTSSASDGLIEGLEDPSAPFIVGVLWHPEQMTGSTDAQRVYDAFVTAAASREAKVR
jgi:putative glutamine amidotransferase